MVAVESQFDIPLTDEIYLVSQRKYNLDENRPFWEIAFFRLIWLPVVRFGFKWMHVPAPSAMDSEGRVTLIEQAGAYSELAMAEARCENEFFSVKCLPFDVDMPNLSVQYKGHRTPLSTMPDRYRRRTFPITIAPDHQMQEVKRNLEQTIKSLAAT